MNTSGPHTIYTLFADPLSPWQNTTGQGSPGENAWVFALDILMDKAGCNGLASEAVAMGYITQYSFGGSGMQYDTKFGSPSFMPLGTGGTFDLTDYLRGQPTSVNCYDQAGAVAVLSRLLGIKSQYVYMKPFGFIPAIALVGGVSCNNPGYMNPQIPPADQQPIVPEGFPWAPA